MKRASIIRCVPRECLAGHREPIEAQAMMSTASTWPIKDYPGST